MHPLQKLPVALFLLLALLGAPAHAATYTVTNTVDSGAGSLRQAMLDALATPADDEIVFDPATNGSPITLASPLPDVLESGGDLTITGNGAAHTIIDGNGAHRPLYAGWQPGLDLAVRHLTLRNGLADQHQGGAIHVRSIASLVVEAVEFVGNGSTYEGGALYSHNTATTVTRSLFSGNRTGTLGGAFANSGGTLLFSNSTVVGNNGTSIVELEDGLFRMINLTVVNNNTSHETFLVRGTSTASVSNSLIANNTGVRDLRELNAGAFDVASSHNNVIEKPGNSGVSDGVNGNQVGVSQSWLGPLGDYGGTTRTMPLLPGSSAIDQGTTTGGDIPAADQRGIARVGAPDIGAFESRGFALSGVSGGGQTAQVSTAFADPLVVQVTANAPIEPVEGGRVAFSAPSSGASATLGSATATVGSNGRAQTTATANATVGGPYNVTATDASVGGSSQTFALTNTAAPVYYTIGGSVSGLTGTGLVLRNNGGDDRAVNANGSFTFATSVVQGGSYNVSIHTQPSGQRCTVAQASGSGVAASVNNVAVACTPYFEGTTVPSSGTGGLATATFTGGGNGCRFDLGATGFEAAPTALPPGRTLPQGMLRVKLVGCTAAVAMEVTWPEPVVGYTKHGLAASTDTQPSYFAPAGLAISGRTARFTLTDGAQGDDDWTLNGEIADPAGPMVLAAGPGGPGGGGPGGPGGAQAIPTLSEWGLLLLSALLGLVALRIRGRA